MERTENTNKKYLIGELSRLNGKLNLKIAKKEEVNFLTDRLSDLNFWREHANIS